MNVKDFLDLVAYITVSSIPGDRGKIYQSKFDDSYITRVGMEEHVQFLADREITHQLSHGTGFSPKDGKWYGWSHRAIYGFEIGSTCKKGDCHYVPANETDAIEQGINFWDDEYHTYTRAGMKDTVHSRPGVWIEWEYTNDVPNKRLRGTTSSVFWAFPDTWGRGEWTAETEEDAREMAIAFNKAVS